MNNYLKLLSSYLKTMTITDVVDDDDDYDGEDNDFDGDDCYL